jgi:LysM repeat protein
MYKIILLLLILVSFSSCSPLRSSPNDEKHQLELTLHEVQTNLDDLRHDINCFQTELQILDGRIKYNENTLSSLKQDGLEKQQSKLDFLMQQVQSLEKKWSTLEKGQQSHNKDMAELSSHANETSAALAQFKDRINELEEELVSQHRKSDELAKLRNHMDPFSKGSVRTYKVKPGDSLEKIAKAHKTTVEKIKKLNDLEQDLIVVGKELSIPGE